MHQLAIPQPAAVPTSILAQRPAPQVPIGGVIRPGIKLLTQTAQQDAAARDLYERGCAAGKSFDAIEADIRKAVPGLTNPLRPANVPYFSVRRADFQTPELADLLLVRYGETRDDGVRRLYRFPVVFAMDAWEQLLPHTLQVWAAGKRTYWAEYDEAGERRCKTHASVPKDAAGRVIRLFGGRKVVDRPESGGRCDPERCPQYQGRQCNLDARLLFLVPGLPTVNLLALPTRSFYSMDGIRRQLLHVARMRGGRLAGYLPGRQTFWLSKVYKEVTRIDDHGEAVKGGAWLIELQAPVDVAGLLQADEPARIEAAAQAAVGVLEGGVVDADPPASLQAAQPAPDSRALVKQLRAEVAAALARYGIDIEVFKAFARETWRTEDWGRSPESLGDAAALLKQLGPKLVRLRLLLHGMNVPIDRHAAYASRRYRSAHWQLRPELVARAIREAEECAQTPDGLAAQVDSVLHTA